MSNIRYKRIPLEKLHVEVERMMFGTANGATEIHAIVHLMPDFPADGDAVAALLEAKFALEMFLRARTLHGRLLLGDKAMQKPFGDIGHDLAAIGQQPLDGTAAALWLWMTQGAPNAAYRHSFGCGESSATTLPLLENYRKRLADKGLTLADNCLRTWFFMRDIDHNYKEMVDARREFFAANGLTPATHFIASTGINGNPLCNEDIVQLETYTVEGLNPAQISYLKGSSHLNPTAEYGVTFERGTRVEYGDRCHLIISGTASIDNRGQILYPDDAEMQTRRMVENVRVLLDEGGASANDMMHAIVYVRRPEDYATVRRVLDALLPDLPKVIVHAPVCRPGWLVEMECIAVTVNRNDAFAPF